MNARENCIPPSGRQGRRFRHRVPGAASADTPTVRLPIYPPHGHPADFDAPWPRGRTCSLVSPIGHPSLTLLSLRERPLEQARWRPRTIKTREDVKGGVILGHGVLMFSDSVLPNWSAKMSDHGDINVDAERTGKTSGAQQPAGRAYDYGPGGDSNGSEHTPHQAHPGGLP